MLHHTNTCLAAKSGLIHNRQSTTNNMAMLTKVEMAKDDAAKYKMAVFEDKPIEIDEMQIDKLYQPL